MESSSIRAFVFREQGACRVELAAIRSGGPPTSIVGAVAWSLAAVAWGNAVVFAGRRFGHDQWVTLIAVPLFGLAGWWWLRRRGFRRQALGAQRPRTDHAPFLTALTVTAAGFAGICAIAGLATFGQELRGLRTIRTIVGTAFGEELIHRGVLLAVWASTGLAGWQVAGANMIVFGTWHLAGAVCDGFHPAGVIGPAALAVPLVWLRLRFRSIFAPIAFHAATNLPAVFNPPTPPCS